LQREQHYLDILFSSLYPRHLRYNFLPTAGSSLGYKHTEEALAKMSGRTHTPETRAQMSDSQKLVDRTGALNPMYGKVPASAFQSGYAANNPMYGKSGSLNPMYGITPTNAMTINVYGIDNVLVHSFPSQVAAAKWLNIPRTTFREYLSTGKVWNNQYIFRKSK
jgi:group I intron endonuclease